MDYGFVRLLSRYLNSLTLMLRFVLTMVSLTFLLVGLGFSALNVVALLLLMLYLVLTPYVVLILRLLLVSGLLLLDSDYLLLGIVAYLSLF